MHGPCTGEVDPEAESCNGLDDDCNGTVDDASAIGMVSCGVGFCSATVNACTAGTPVAEICANGIDDNWQCGAYVSPTGIDTNLGSAVAPLQTISAAITKISDASGVTKSVCVASGAAAPSTFDYTEAIIMQSGLVPSWPQHGQLGDQLLGRLPRVVAGSDRFAERHLRRPCHEHGRLGRRPAARQCDRNPDPYQQHQREHRGQEQENICDIGMDEFKP